MKPSQLNTITVPASGSPNPATLVRAADVPLRVVVYNAGPVLVFLAHDVGTLGVTPVFANARPLPPDREITIVLEPKQGLFAAGRGAGGVVAVAISEAIPTKWMEA